MPSPSNYSGISTINHWITSLLIVSMLALGLTGGFAPDEPTGEYVLDVHVALGFFVLLFVIWRVIYRLYEGFPPTQGNTPAVRKTAYVVHRLLLLFITLQVLTGPLYLFTEGEGMNVFGWFTFYIPLEFLALFHELMEAIHIYTGVYILPVLILLHIGGGIRHFMSTRQETPADM